MSIRERTEWLLSTLLTLATVAVAVVVVEQRVRGGRPPTEQPQRVETVRDWTSVASGALVRLSGPDTAAVKIVTFTDFECPFCRALDSILTEVGQANPDRVQLSLVHFPLKSHRFSQGAAVALECADALGAAASMRSALFAQQPKIGVWGWSDFARVAEIRELARFESCVTEPREFVRIQRGSALADSLRLSGTPVVVINGRLYDPAPIDVVRSVVESLLEGENP